MFWALPRTQISLLAEPSESRANVLNEICLLYANEICLLYRITIV